MCPTLKIHAYWVRSYVDGGLRCKECPSDLITDADIDIDIVDNRLASCSELVHHFTAILLIETRQRLWRRSIVVRTLVSAGELSLSCAQTASWMGDHFEVKPSAIGQPTWPTQPSIPQGSVNEYWSV